MATGKADAIRSSQPARALLHRDTRGAICHDVVDLARIGATQDPHLLIDVLEVRQTREPGDIAPAESTTSQRLVVDERVVAIADLRPCAVVTHAPPLAARAAFERRCSHQASYSSASMTPLGSTRSSVASAPHSRQVRLRISLSLSVCTSNRSPALPAFRDFEHPLQVTMTSSS